MKIDVSESEFDATVLQKSRSVPVIVDFWAPWCGPCRVLGPVLERLAEEADGSWILAKVDTDQNQGLARQFRIQGIPAVKAFVDGKVVAEFTGALPESQIRRFLEKIRPDPVAQTLQAATEALQRSDRSEAGRLYAQLPDHPDSLLFAAEEALDRGQRAEAADLLKRAGPPPGPRGARLQLALSAPGLAEALQNYAQHPEDPRSRWELAVAEAAAGKYEEALERLLGLVRQHRSWEGDRARKTMPQVFDIVGIRSPLADVWRSRLAAELYK
jgi:putative thioredoxin